MEWSGLVTTATSCTYASDTNNNNNSNNNNVCTSPHANDGRVNILQSLGYIQFVCGEERSTSPSLAARETASVLEHNLPGGGESGRLRFSQSN